MSAVSIGKALKVETISDNNMPIKDKMSNKFSIENILGLNDSAKVNRLELSNFYHKGKVDN